MEYNIIIKKTKNIALCRICRKKIISGDMVCRMDIIDEYSGTKSMQTHIDCLLTKIIKDVIKIKEEKLKSEMTKFKNIQKVLENGR
jgi:hypothetical protein